MSLKDLEESFNLINKNFSASETGFSGPKKMILIEEAEEILHLQFPITYKTFLEKVGHGGPGSAFIPGIYVESIEELESSGIVYGVLNDRKSLNYPHNLVGIYDVGEGTTYCLDTSQFDENGECPVVVWPIGGYEETPILEIINKDFGEFFLEKVKEQVNNKNNYQSE